MLRSIAFALALAVVSSATAADLVSVSKGPICLSSADSTILELKRPKLIVALQNYRDDAQAASLDKSIVFSRTTTFDWAVAAVVQCNVALGYLQGGHLDKASATKCDCFHSHLPVLQ